MVKNALKGFVRRLVRELRRRSDTSAAPAIKFPQPPARPKSVVQARILFPESVETEAQAGAPPVAKHVVRVVASGENYWIKKL